MRDDFADALSSVVAGYLAFRAGSVDEQPRPEAALAYFIELIDDFAASGQARPDQAVDYDLGRAALVYWIDEMLTLEPDRDHPLRLDWDHDHRERFRDICLELHYRDLRRLIDAPGQGADRDVQAPYRFYHTAQAARDRPTPCALEAHLYCVALGFEGRLRTEPARRDWVVGAYNHIRSRIERPPDGPEFGGEPPSRLAGPRRFFAVALVFVAATAATVSALIVAVHLRPY